MDPATIFRIVTEEPAFHIYSALTTYGTTSEPVPDLAQGWEQVDPTTVTFQLHQGVQFHKGYGELTSEDVKFSYERILNPSTGSTYANSFKGIDSIEAPDAKTVTIKLKEPDANFFHNVANYHQGAVIRKEALEALGEDYAYNPVGTGPFDVTSFAPDALVLSRFDEYFKEPATLERIHFESVADQETAAIAFENGEFEILGSTTNQDTFKRLQANEQIALHWHDNSSIPIVGLFSGRVDVLKDPRVRKAFSHAIDTEAVLKATDPNTYRLWNSILPDWMDGYTDDLPTFGYDVETAKQLLSAAGYAGGLTLKLMTNSVTADAQFEQDYLSKVGITLEFEVVDQAAFVSRRPAGEFEVSFRGYPAVNPDEILFGHFHTDHAPPNGLNNAFYSNSEVDTLLEKARVEFDFDARVAMYIEAQQIAMADAPYRAKNCSRRPIFAHKTIDRLDANPLTNVLFGSMKVLKKA